MQYYGTIKYDTLQKKIVSHNPEVVDSSPASATISSVHNGFALWTLILYTLCRVKRLFHTLAEVSMVSGDFGGFRNIQVACKGATDFDSLGAVSTCLFRFVDDDFSTSSESSGAVRGTFPENSEQPSGNAVVPVLRCPLSPTVHTAARTFRMVFFRVLFYLHKTNVCATMTEVCPPFPEFMGRKRQGVLR